MKFVLFLLLVGAVVACRKRQECHRAPPQPTFLKEVGPNARMEYFAILMNKTATIAELNEAVLAWAKRYNVEKQQEEYNNTVTAYAEELKHNVTNLVAELPKALDRFISISQRKDQTIADMMKGLKEMREQEFEVFDVVWKAFNVFKPTYCLHRNHKKPGYSLNLGRLDDDLENGLENEDTSEEFELDGGLAEMHGLGGFSDALKFL
ncbi:DUF148 domain-containing protein [Trichostrongylus colubriformis]|uniref:DUF148 domain-containing protein n=1 Tax=Trichostrongylus colubriformis TaxID=6319 RepID=A0AAN8FBG2_TRICO